MGRFIVGAVASLFFFVVPYVLVDRTRRGESATPILEKLLRRLDVLQNSLDSGGFWSALATRLADSVLGDQRDEASDEDESIAGDEEVPGNATGDTLPRLSKEVRVG